MNKLKYFLLTKTIGLYINLLAYINPRKASALAYHLFSTPRDGRLLAGSLPDILKDAYRETFNHNGHEFQSYRWDGTGAVILLVHGWESNASRWEKMLPHLKASGSTVIAIDGPAHGLSADGEFNVPAYAEVIDEAVKRFKPDYLIGHSIGGAACVYYQYKYQNANLRKMVVLGAPSDLKTLIQNFVSLLSLNSRMIGLLENHFLEKFRVRLEDFSGRIFGANLRLKGIIAHDVDDTVVAFDEGKKIAGAWKDAIFIQTKGLGHSMHDDDLYRRISEFLFVAD